MLISKKVPEASAEAITENIMIDALIFALAAVAMGIPAIITATTLGSKLEFDW